MTAIVTRETAPERARGRSDTGRTLRLLTRFAGGERRAFLLAFGMLAFEAMTAVFQAYPLAYLIDYLQGDRGALALPGIASERVATIAVLTLAIVVLAAVNSAADSMAEIYMARGGRTLGYWLRVSLFSHLQRLSLAFHDRRRTGDVITRVTGDVREIEEFVIKSGSDLAGSALLLVGTLTFLAFHSWQVTLVALAIVPVLASISHWFSKRIKAAARQQRAAEGDVASTTQEMLTAIRVVQTFGRASYDEQRFAVQSGAAMDAAFEAARLQAWFSWAVSGFQAVSIAVVVWMGLWLIDRGAITVGTLVLFVILISNMFKPTRRIIREWATLAKLYASVERIADLLDRRPSVRDEPGAVPAPPLQGAVELRGVSFSYEVDPEDVANTVGAGARRAALQDVSFEIAPGEVVALVGHSGAGKTTVAQLLPRLYDPQQGAVLIDGRDVKGFTLESLRSQISIVLQETILLSGTVAENIAYGRMGATREEIVNAAVLANAHEFIQQLPDGYETDLSERAGNLSGGQRQRLAIARAFIRDTPLLILDEPTTGLDAESTGLVLTALRTLMRGKTTLIISHDFGLIRWADRILVLREGRVEQAGTHEALLEDGGVYAGLYAKQFSGFESPDRDDAHPVEGNGQPSEPLEPFEAVAALADLRAAEADAVDGNGQPSEPLEPFEAVLAASEPTTADDGAPARAASTELPSDELSIDARRSPVLLHELPDLATALDGVAMRELLESALVGEGYTIEGCMPDKALYLPEEGCVIRYELEIRGADGSSGRYLVGGRLFPDQATSADFLRTRLLPLAHIAEGRAELAPFAKAVSTLDPLPMAAYAFPIDPELPLLVGATDEQRLLGLFRFQVEPSGYSVDAERCRVELVHYPRRARCVLRYDIEGTLRSGEQARRTVYGRVTAEPPDMGVAAAALREWSRRVFPDRFLVPRLLAFRPEVGVSFVEAIPGVPRIAQLIESGAGAGPAPETTLALEEAVGACADIAAVLHAADIETGGSRSLDDELEALRPAISSVRRISPALGAQLTDRIEQLGAEAASSQPLPSVFCHGDYTPAQVVFDGTNSGLLDLDTLCQAEAALDLGHFSAYLRVLCRKAERKSSSPSALGSELSQRFLHSYIDAAGTPLEEEERLLGRVRAYEAVSLVRMAVHSWQQLKPVRTADVMSVLEERASLPAPAR